MCTELNVNGTSSTSTAPTYEEIVSLIGYLAQIPDENSIRQGFTVLIDGRHASIKHVRNALRACQVRVLFTFRSIVINLKTVKYH